jgi:uncharacterized membrane protein YedE/YeeE
MGICHRDVCERLYRGSFFQEVVEMTGPLIVSQQTGLFIAVVLGFFFGFFLERGGLGNPHKLTGVFYLADFVVPKVMFTAILVASTGFYLLSDLKLLDLDRVWIVPTFFWPQLAGGALFGIGFVVSGYCPGTSVAGLASGRLDALFTMTGIGIGSAAFAVVYPMLEDFYQSSSMGVATIPTITGLNHWTVLAALGVLAGLMFCLMEKFEKKSK